MHVFNDDNKSALVDPTTLSLHLHKLNFAYSKINAQILATNVEPCDYTQLE